GAAARSRWQALQSGHQPEVAGDAQLGIERRVLGEVAHGPPACERLAQWIMTGDAHLARGGREDAREDAHGGRLAGAVGAEKADDLALANAEGGSRDRPHPAES